MNGNLRKDGESGWSSRDEIDYITHIGEHKEPKYSSLSPTQKLGRKVSMLRGYIAGLGKRVNWGTIDKERIVAFASGELARMEK